MLSHVGYTESSEEKKPSFGGKFHPFDDDTRKATPTPTRFPISSGQGFAIQDLKSEIFLLCNFVKKEK